jgi:hypothetical protein
MSPFPLPLISQRPITYSSMFLYGNKKHQCADTCSG